MNLTEFIVASNRVHDIASLTELFLRFISPYGLDRFLMGDLSRSENKGDEDFTLLVNYPKEWMERYIVHNYINYDPVSCRAKETGGVFTWKDVLRNDLSPASKLVMNEATDFDLRSGIGISIHRPFGKIIGFGLASSYEKLELDNNALSILYAAVNQFYIVYRDIIRGAARVESIESITSREREILTQLACGKTKSEVADYLAVSLSCVKRHCESIFQKLDANNVTYAVVQAIKLGLIY